MRYLEIKNKWFFETAKMLDSEGLLEESLYYLESEEGPEKEYFSLIALYFTDEEGYQRALFLPFPLLEGRGRIKRKILKIISELPESHRVSRAWHDSPHCGHSLPTSYYPDPPQPLQPEEYEENEEF
ncbi:MAG: hypothetical protein ACP5IB_07765 [Thermoplasmata archaeon]